jgi:cell division protein FtsI (penicillin-binding protein 3)
MRGSQYRWRLALLYFAPFVCFFCVVARLGYLQVVRHEYYSNKAAEQHHKKIVIAPSRGKIYDRNGHELAGATLVQTSYIDPALIREEHVPDFSREVAKALNLDVEAVPSQMMGRKHLPLVRKMTPEQVAALDKVRRKFRKIVPINAIYYRQENKRYYTRDSLAAHVIGFAGMDNTGDNLGLSGIERYYDKELRGKTEEVKARKNAVESALEPVDPERLAATYGHSVVLTIDEAIQRATEAALARGVQESQADAGIATVYNVKTGEFLAMASCPSFDLNQIGGSQDFQRKNRVLTDVIEPGSVMKIFTFAALFEEGKLQATETVNCEGGRWSIPGRTITDSSTRLGSIPAQDVFKFSSNVGTVKLAITRLTNQQMYNRFALFGFGQRTGIDLPDEEPGLLRPVSEWDGLTRSSLPMGYALLVSGVQVTAAAAAIANDGIYMKPHIVKEIRDYRGETVRRFEPQALRRVCSPATSRKMLELMELVVTEGTGKAAACDDYRVGGKTGTTKKHDREGGGYTMKNYIASFCGVAPVTRPEICIYVWIDNPRGGKYYGGAVAGPVFREIATEALKILQVPVCPPQPKRNTKPLPVELANLEGGMDTRRTTAPASLLLSRARAEETLLPGTMPDLRGLTMREATQRLVALNIPYHFDGSGVVVEQIPRPYETVEPGDVAVISFRPEVAVVESMADGGAVGSAVESSGTGRIRTPSLVLERNNRAVEIKATAAQASALGSGMVRARHVTPPTAEPSKPDLDPRVQRKPDLALGRSVWEEWKRESSAGVAVSPPVAGQAAAQTAVTEGAPRSADPVAVASSARGESAPEEAARPAATTRASERSAAGPINSLYDMREVGGL